MRETLLELRLSNWNHWYSGGYILNQSQGVNLKGICVILSFLYLSYNSNKPQTIRNGQARYKSSGGAGKNNGNCNIRTETSTTQKVIALVSLLHPTKIIPKTLDPATHFNSKKSVATFNIWSFHQLLPASNKKVSRFIRK